MSTENLKELRNALSCWQDDYDCDDDKEQYDMFGAAIDAISRLEVAERANSAQSDHINQQQDRIDSLEQKNAALGNALGTAERERDELRAEQAEHDEQIARMEGKFSLAKRALDSKTARCDRAEAEIARRDAAAGEPVAVVDIQRGRGDGKKFALCYTSAGHSLPDDVYNLYTAAQHAALPPAMTYAEALKASDWKNDQASIWVEGANWMRQQCLELGAQPQKVVELPASKSMLTRNSLDEDYVTCIAVPLSDLTEALDAASVKYEVKP